MLTGIDAKFLICISILIDSDCFDINLLQSQLKRIFLCIRIGFRLINGRALTNLFICIFSCLRLPPFVSSCACLIIQLNLSSYVVSLKIRRRRSLISPALLGSLNDFSGRLKTNTCCQVTRRSIFH